MNTLYEYNRECSFCISPYYIQSGSPGIIERSILRSMRQLYEDRVLTSEPVDVRLITDAEYDERDGDWSDSPIGAVKIYFLDKEI